ncbi:DNA repair protein RadA [Patescibacteria group bacterium]|nr:DNA repair protein RadA [Patescibacteria group bacterium]
MPKTATKYICNECAAEQSKWAGRCPDCGAWNSLEETVVAVVGKSTAARGRATGSIVEPVSLPKPTKAGSGDRIATGSAEFDRVLGTGIVPGAVVLVGGEPGIGKSTLLLQVAAAVAGDGTVLYVSGEESAEQIALRAERLGVGSDSLKIAGTTQTEDVAATVAAMQPRLVIVDSIQTLVTDQFSSSAGSVAQVRESAARLQAVAKAHRVPVILVGHVTKEGSLAGPKVLEHVVDVVLSLEGERFHGHRLLRGAKNRFGPTDEVGVFEMREDGLQDVSDPAGLFVDPETADASGTAVAAVLEGSRALLVEVQALSVPSSFGYPKRTSSGYDLNKLHLIAAVLMRHAGLKVDTLDLYLNVSGGYRLQEPAGDLAVALAIAGASTNRRTIPRSVAIGEVGLSGEIRSVGGLERRLTEAKRAGVKLAIIPKRGAKIKAPAGMKVVPVGSIKEAIAAGLESVKP